MNSEKLKPILEALFAAADKPLSVNQIFDLFVGDLDQPGKDDIRKAIHELVEKYENSGFELKQVASGFRFQVRADYETWVARLWEQKPPRYSRALMETLALIAYRQPITRGEIEDIRGVSVSTNIIKTLQEREWVKPLGHKDVPGRPTLYGTTREFLDYFNLKSLNQLPTLAEIRDLDQFSPEFPFEEGAGPVATDSPQAEHDSSESAILESENEMSESLQSEITSEAFSDEDNPQDDPTSEENTEDDTSETIRH
ncbi:MAG: SMC-Scp complex subunit ScpB [Pseudomonadota bacterium]